MPAPKLFLGGLTRRLLVAETFCLVPLWIPWKLEIIAFCCALRALSRNCTSWSWRSWASVRTRVWAAIAFWGISFWGGDLDFLVRGFEDFGPWPADWAGAWVLFWVVDFLAGSNL